MQRGKIFQTCEAVGVDRKLRENEFIARCIFTVLFRLTCKNAQLAGLKCYLNL